MPRVKYATVLRILVIFGLFCVWVQILLSASENGLDRDGELMNANETSEQVLALVPQELHKYLTVHPRNVSGNATDRVGPKNTSDILRMIEKYNDEQTIYNEDIYGPVQNDTIIIAIQVHTRLTYLRHLIVSLAQARDIDKTLLVFSHDYYDEEINSLVRSIDFTKVMQIFYPYSIQTHPDEFPGLDPNDCPRDAKIDYAKIIKCNNALHPDVHGHYREAKYTQTKHHWWWKANRIFNQLQCTSGHGGMVVFLEEDHYVAEDFIHMLNLLKNTADRSCPQCEILCLGTYLKTYQYHTTSDKQRKKHLTLSYIQQVRAASEERRKKKLDTQTWNFQVYPNLYSNTQKVEITPWHSSMHNMGFAFNRTVWNNIMELQSQFCAYDDYNWDYSLLHLSQNRMRQNKFKVMLCKGPRVFHIGECGFHHKKSNCNASTVISKVQKLLQNAKRFMYPSRVTATVTNGGAKHNKRLVKGNGGWGDARDQELCTNMTKIGRQPRKFNYKNGMINSQTL
ncbi:alpha-1,6-mannosyl-glycoprotein 2-beta-N-acetylglucosaminyltransferase-like isoform X2 [Pectinophora gossypiella]|uniref:alpha-1,6-mannosyl-glycoprotein 2-beta-N-acetylglucosaminyltransferase-like isoform X2 n=1 Tax=Pectinophora gossypiella TaxID=13191 RepID=UPI00214EA286|nr:alpha-1,6-mannosyl-glycoprotein 2-beta-N-acetylglucosaminyltransferase-like isoform X2 [Pectinophora gossypiella]